MLVNSAYVSQGRGNQGQNPDRGQNYKDEPYPFKQSYVGKDKEEHFQFQNSQIPRDKEEAYPFQNSYVQRDPHHKSPNSNKNFNSYNQKWASNQPNAYPNNRPSDQPVLNKLSSSEYQYKNKMPQYNQGNQNHGNNNQFSKKEYDNRQMNPLMTENFKRTPRKYDKFISNRGRNNLNDNNNVNVKGSARPVSPRRMDTQKSNHSLNGAEMNRNFDNEKKDIQSVKSLQQNIYLNRYEDDCLYMNLEEEYLHRVSKRQGKSANVSINRSMYNFK